jgi:ketosteroid isomerase-like protein
MITIILIAMYKAIVRSKVRATFAALNSQNTEPFFASLAPRFVYRFVGDGALSGERTTVAAMRAWWKRVFTIVPNGRFDVRDITVNGPPWKTTVMAHVVVTAKLANGENYTNEFMQLLRLKMGKITEIRTLEDTQRLHQAMARIESLVPEAAAAPITDAVAVR